MFRSTTLLVTLVAAVFVSGCASHTHMSADQAQSAPDRLYLGEGINMKLALIPAGSFLMGSTAQEKDDWSKPQHPVTITKPFYVGIHEVTQAQFEAVMGYNPANFKDPNRPVEQVSWNMAREFCRKASARTGRTVRLPTEAEWEYSCRAGTTTPYFFGGFGDDVARAEKYAWFGKKAAGTTHPVGQLKPNPWGLYDITGNVNEWCSDYYSDNYDEATEVDPQGPEKQEWEYHIARGNSWDGPANYCRSAERCMRDVATYSANVLGFRVVVATAP